MIALPQWRFSQEANEQWRWIRVAPDGTRIESLPSFSRREDCLMDAIVWAMASRTVSASRFAGP